MRTHIRGQATLSFIILVGGILIEIAIAGSLVAYFLSNSGLSERLAVRAYTAALSGIHDARIKIVRNKEIGFSPVNYALDVALDSAAISITRTSAPGEIYRYTITSRGVAATRVRTLTATLVAHQNTGLVTLESLRES